MLFRSERHETRLRLSVGTGIRPPDAFEIAFTDNPGLKPERSRSLDAGVQQTLAGNRVALESTVFLNSYDDLIVAVGRSFANASQFRTDNIWMKHHNFEVLVADAEQNFAAMNYLLSAWKVEVRRWDALTLVPSYLFPRVVDAFDGGVR